MMSGKTRSQQRAQRGALNLYPAETTLGWRVIGNTTALAAAEKLARGEWREVYDEHGNHLGYQILATFKTDQDLPSPSSSSSITESECELNAFAKIGWVRSFTIGMPEEKRITRGRHRNAMGEYTGPVLPPEDAVERILEKVKEFGRHRLVLPIRKLAVQ
jgi:hypothetical protein